MSISSSSSQSSPPQSGTGSVRNESYWVDPEGTAHERCRLLFFVRNKFQGESPIDPGETPELGYRRGGCAYFCSWCGEVWARVVMVNSQGGNTPFDEVISVACEQHHDHWEVSGSILSGYRNEGYLKYLPPEMVVREFLIHLREMERL